LKVACNLLQEVMNFKRIIDFDQGHWPKPGPMRDPT
jgi:hypothetical protein